MDPDEWMQEFYTSTDFDTPNELEVWVKKTESNIKRKQKKDAGEEEVEEDPVFPLVDRPDEELTEDEIREKRKQRLMKAGWEARVKIREEKQREKERVEEEKRKEEEERQLDPEGWARKMRLQHEVRPFHAQVAEFRAKEGRPSLREWRSARSKRRSGRTESQRHRRAG
jgi:actin-related protein 5